MCKWKNKMTTQEAYYNLGTFHRPVSTTNIAAQEWFNRGLVWSYAFNHQESAACFQKAWTADKDCAMAYWGYAYALGPNYNKPWAIFDKEDLQSTLAMAHDAARLANEKSASASPVEKALCHAIQFRYPQDQPDEDCSIWNNQYADAMTKVYQDFPDDFDVATLCSDALMNLTPWKLWDVRTGKPAEGAHTVQIKAILDRALQQGGATSHPGLLHLYVHLMEMSATPEAALSVADHLRGLVPDAGHLNHMPSHLHVLCGDYRRVVESNQAAIRADEKFAVHTGGANFYTLYRAHDYHFCIYGAMFAAQSKVALDTVAKLEAALPEDLLRVESPPMADWLEGFLTMRVHILVRFGRWQDIINLKLPEDRKLYCVTTAMTYYAKGVANAALGNIDAAMDARKDFQEATDAVPPSRSLFNNACRDLLSIAGAMLEGEIAYRNGDFEPGFEHLRRAVHLDENLPYDEPWGWMQPTRHALGALLLEQGRTEEAASVYCADLGLDETLPRALQHPNNVWSLHGYHECLKTLGRNAEAKIIGQQLKLAEAVADVPIVSSCMCRRNTSIT
jgi:tetratricopeptide (TPR) repeat protein